VKNKDFSYNLDLVTSFDAEDPFEELLSNVSDAAYLPDGEWPDKLQDGVLVGRKLELTSVLKT